ncbi:Cellulose synthase-like protein D1 [Ananas comosus]|uniref:Cellulose synthase-like protein D1 n=1 Tax=Ananas comosus TaxID=4615 RepID=A0A199VKC4_ANACO|nr:Cellulose synthase-like protein D1 [Ananas comosus]
MAFRSFLKKSSSSSGSRMTIPSDQAPPKVVIGQQTDSGRFAGYSHDDLNSFDPSSAEYQVYHVQIPMTPDNRSVTAGGRSADLVDPAISARVEEHYISNSLFTGGFNVVTQAHLMDRVTDPAAAADHNNKNSSTCSIRGCDSKVYKNQHGDDVLPCDCSFKICAECFADAVKTGGGLCPGCKEQYKTTEWKEVVAGANNDHDDEDEEQTLSLPPPPPMGPAGKLERRLSLMRPVSQGRKGDQFDQNRWLFETNGTYGYGNAIWPDDGGEAVADDDDDDENGGDGGGGVVVGIGMEAMELFNKPWRPLTRKLKIPAAVLSPYRLLILVRLVALALFLQWRIRHKNRDAVWLWGMSIVCELWFSFSWLLDQLPKLCPINRAADLSVLREKFETPTPNNPAGKSDLPGIDVFVSTADPEKEPVLVTANTILSILAADYPVEKLTCYVSDDGGALLTFEAMAEAASFANLWVPFCRKHNIEPRNPESYFNLKRDPYRKKVGADFVRDRRRMKREYDEFKVRINGLLDTIRRRSEMYNAREEIQAAGQQRERVGDEPIEPMKTPKATWMADGTHWPGTWIQQSKDHSRGDHAGIIQVMLRPPSDLPTKGGGDDEKPMIDFKDVDVRLPMLVYVSREKRPGYDHNKKAGAMNALVRASAVMSNGPFILNLDCDHYVYNSKAFREGMCFMMDRGGDRICYVQFPQRFEGIDPSDRYANHNTVFFDVNMRALDGLQGPVYVGTGCLFRRTALYGFDPPRAKEYYPTKKRKVRRVGSEETRALRATDLDDGGGAMNLAAFPRRFGESSFLIESIPVAEFQGRPLGDHPSVKNGRAPGALLVPRRGLDATVVAEGISVVSCWYEEQTEWGRRVGWIYGSVTEDVVTGYRMHNRGWRSVYCVTPGRDAFRGTAPINLTDRLQQVLRWATGSVEIFFSRNNALLARPRMKVLQRIAYLNVGIYPFTSAFLIAYCFLPALSLLSGQFIVQTLDVAFLAYLLAITVTLFLLAALEIRWAGIGLEEWWRNEQFWLIGGTSAHLAAVLQGLLKIVAGVEISFTLTSKSAGEEGDDEFADLHAVKWTSLMVPPITIIMVNVMAIAVGVIRTVNSVIPQWSQLLGGVFFSLWVLAHLYPFAKGLMGRRGRTPTVVYIWSGLLATSVSLILVLVRSPSANHFTFP